ncbi:YEATS domain-containing protein 2 isoform X1 [Clupea harengus]|uniref:YEATS domain-containing protein 2 n=1 Tax=Clupea harengus TaxID=7950 RepID=A0A6P8ETD6_CLUHA|nr:YEATS domain-containing protein 2 isoform X1 [Clupea harengus]XP_031415345.1 YEATS domain-containing protein 2 isoform X1 [Clupea harengus]XP_031415347.1 YEATS domain-containing protein 2 isoform X1 [Clupea harengus]XP_031415348.1 YEATS domain-containing protein 2 isoform X1 [Clupea harengus]XP_042558905.1 YEATS domain-containing protein 2 isoform X1 [Clupea harengus]
MSGIKRKIEDNDPDYEDISQVHENKRNKLVEQNAREAAVQKIEVIVREQFSLEMKNKEHEIEVIGQRLNEARRMMDKLRACIVANYYANAGQPKVQEASKSDVSVLNHPAIKRFLESPSRSSSPLNQGSEAASLGPSESESLGQHADGERDRDGAWREAGGRGERRPGRNTGKDTFGVPASGAAEQHVTYHSTGEEASRLYVKKTIVVGNVSKYIAPDKREENDQSTHKWMVYVRGSKKEPSIDHFVRKVWFFLHPSYKPNDLVEVSEPPFHLTRRGWGEFPVRVQIHFKDTRNKRIDIIHNLKLDRTYTGLQTLGAETVVDVELHRNSLGEDFLPTPLSSSSSSSASSQRSCTAGSSSAHPTSAASPCPLSQDSLPGTEKGVAVKCESGRSSCSERTPSRPKLTEKITLGSHGNSAFQPITASCKIIPQGQAPSLSESPGKSFQPITMSCKIVSGSPISTPSHSPLPRTPTSTPAQLKQGSSVVSNPYIIVDKPGQVISVAGSSSSATGSPTAKLSAAAHGTRSPAPKVHTGSFLSSGVKVIIKQEPGEVPTQPQPPPQQAIVSTATTQQQQAATQQFVAVKGGHVITMSSSQKQGGGVSGSGATPSKVLGIPMSSALQSAVKQVAISSGQILVAKSNPAVSKVMAQKQVVAQGVAKAIVSSGGGGPGGGAGGGGAGQQVHTVTKAAGGSASGGKGGVMATLQLPANNLANLANLPPGTKLYLTTNSKNPSGKGKLLLIPQGAILRASSSGQQSQSAAPSGSSQTSSGSGSGSSLPSHLSYTSYILKQTPQGTFLVGQPGGSAKQSSTSASSGHVASGAASVNQQSIRVTAGQKAAILAQVVGGSQASQVKLSDGSVKTVTSAAHLPKPGTTTLRMTGGLITATSTTQSTLASAAATSTQHTADGTSVPSSPAPSSSSSSSSSSSGAKPVSQQHSLLVAANQAAVINAAKNASNAAAAAAAAAAANSAAKSSTGALVTVAKSMAANMPVISMGKGAGQAVVSVPKSASPSLVTAASLVGSGGGVSGKAAATLSGMLKLHTGQPSSQQTVLTIPANQLKQLSVGTGTGGVQTILMPVGKVVQSSPSFCKGSSSSNSAVTHIAPAASSTPNVAHVKTEPGVYSCSGPRPQTPTSYSSSSAPGSGLAPTPAMASVKVEQGTESTHELNTEHIVDGTQLLTAVVKKFPLIVPEKNEDSHPFCATSVEQYYSWNIGKRRAAELQRAVSVKRLVQEVLEKSPRLQAIPPPKTREVVQWCRHRGYTPPDPEPRRAEEDSIEDILTQIDNEPECPSTLLDAEDLCQRVEQLQRLLKTEPIEEEDNGEPLDVLSLSPPSASASGRPRPKQEPHSGPQEPSYHLGPDPSQQFIRDSAEQIGVTFQPVEVEKNVFAPVVEAMILKATEQFASDVLREALANGHMKSPPNRAPREVSVMNVHQSVSSIPACDFLTNRYMGVLLKENGHAD